MRTYNVFTSISLKNMSRFLQKEWPQKKIYCKSNKNVTNFLLLKLVIMYGIQVPDVDGGHIDSRNLLLVVDGTEDSDFYKLANNNGTLEQLNTRNQLVIC